MKRKIAIVFVMLLVCVMMTGCMRLEIAIDVKENNKADLSVLAAISNTMAAYSDEGLLSQEDIQNAIENGWSVAEYNEGDYKGYLLTREDVALDNISEESNTNTYQQGVRIFDNKVFSKNKNYYALNIIPFGDEQRNQLETYADVIKSTGGFARITVSLPEEAEECNASSQSVEDEKYRYTWNLLDSQDNGVVTLLFKAPHKINLLIILLVISGVLLLITVTKKILDSNEIALYLENCSENNSTENDDEVENQEKENEDTEDVENVQESEEKVSQSKIQICPNCGMIIKSGYQFCTHCGKKYE